MNTSQIVAVGLVAVLIGGGIWFLNHNKDTDKYVEGDEEGQVLPETSERPERVTGTGTLAELAGLGRNVSCDFSETRDGAVASEGTFYYDSASDRIRLEAELVEDGERFESHMINDGNDIYVWTRNRAEEFAMKMVVPEEDPAAADTAMPTFEDMESEQSAVSMDSQVEYDCRGWRVDSSVFVPPADVEFMDPQAMMLEMMGDIELPEGVELPEGFEMPTGLPAPQ